MKSLDLAPTTEELKGVKDILASVLIGMKNYTLYPENHSICKKSVENTNARLNGFLKHYDSLKLNFTKDQIIYKSEVIFQQTADSENPATIFFRDGIQYVKFFEGFKSDDLNVFFRILKENKNWQEDADGDLVTAFWEADLPNFKYMAVDIYWDSEPLIDYSLLNTASEKEHLAVEPEDPAPNTLGMETSDPADTVWKLNENEMKELRKMIQEEENRDNLNDLLFVLFVLLKAQDENDDFKSALEFLEGELLQALAQGDFYFAYRLMGGLWSIRKGLEKQKAWAQDALDQFFMKVSDPDVLNIVPRNLQSLDTFSSEEIKLFRRFFLLLYPSAVLVLGHMLLKTRSSNAQQQIRQVIKVLSERDIRPLAQLLDSPNEAMVRELVPVLGQMEGQKPVQYLLRLLKHQSDGVRKQAVQHLAALNAEVIKQLFALIEDANASIRSLVLNRFSKVRNRAVEDLLLDYLEKGKFAINNHQHILACYRALGRCGSDRSIAFLHKALFERSWLPYFRSLHRNGASVALAALKTETSRGILEKASKSFFPSVRMAYRKAMEAKQW